MFKVNQNKMVTYRIIPHADVTNSNKRLWRSIYKMFEMYTGSRTRLERDGFRFTLRENDRFWYDIVFRQEEGKKKIEFYISTTEYQAQKLKRKLENKISITMTEAEIIQVPQENTIIQEMKLVHHDIFSLQTNTNDTKTPIANIMNLADELTFDGDLCRISVCAEAENRKRWVSNSSYAYEKLSKGKIPFRSALDGKRAIAYTKIGIASLINEIQGLVMDVFGAFDNVFFKSDKKFEKNPISNAHGIADEIGTNRISREKGNLPVFKTWIRVAAHSDDRLTREVMAETAALAYTDLTDQNELQGVKINIRARKKEVIDELNSLHLSNRSIFDSSVNMLSTDEMAKVAVQMPVKELQRRYSDALDIKQRIEINIPEAFRNEDGIRLGTAQLKDESIPVYMPVSNPDSFYRGYVMTGGQGAGKDTMIKNFVVDGCLNHGISFVIPDAIVEQGSRGMADGIRDALPPEKVIDLDLNDDNFIPPLDLTEVIEKLGRNGSSRFADEMIDFLQIEGLARSEKYLTDAAKASGGNLFNIKRIIEDDEYRADIIEKLLNEGNMRLANELLKWGDNEELGNKCDAILTRLNRFFGNERLYDIFSQKPLPELDFAKWMQEGKVIIIRVPNGRGLGEHAVKTLVHWITLKTFMTRMLMTKEEQANGAFIVFNEPEQYESEGLTKLMGRVGTEGRKERLGSIYAFHHWNKLKPSLQENLQGGGVQQFLFANDHTETFKKSAHRFEEVIPLEEAYKLPVHHSIVSVRVNGELCHPFICKMSPPCKTPFNNAKLTKEHTKKYGRSWKSLQHC